MKYRQFILIISSLIVPMLILTGLALSSNISQNISNISGEINVEDVIVFYINNTGIESSILDQMKDLGVQTKSLDIEELIYDTQSLNINQLSVVLFDSQWFYTQRENGDVHDLLREVTDNGGKLTSVGESTSRFFEVLDEAGIYVLGRNEDGNIRNPVCNDPAIVGFKFKQGITPSGESYLYPSIFASNAEETSVNLEYLTSWIGG